MDAYGLPQKHENGEFGQGVEMNMSRFDTHDYVSHSNGLEGEGKYNVRQDMSSEDLKQLVADERDQKYDEFIQAAGPVTWHDRCLQLCNCLPDDYFHAKRYARELVYDFPSMRRHRLYVYVNGSKKRVNEILGVTYHAKRRWKMLKTIVRASFELRFRSRIAKIVIGKSGYLRLLRDEAIQTRKLLEDKFEKFSAGKSLMEQRSQMNMVAQAKLRKKRIARQWILLIAASALVYAFSFPIEIAFKATSSSTRNRDEVTTGSLMSGSLLATAKSINIIIDILWILDLIRLLVPKPPNELLKAEYFTHKPWLDVFCALPYWRLFVNQSVTTVNSMHLTAGVALTSIPGVLSLCRVVKLTYAIEFVKEESSLRVELSALFVGLLVIIHVYCCFFFEVAVTSGYFFKYLGPRHHFETAYSEVFFISLMILTGRSPFDYVPTTPGEKAVFGIGGILSYALLLLCVAVTTTTVISLRSASQEMQKQIGELEAYMEFRRVPQKMRATLRECYASKWQNKQYFNEGNVLSSLTAHTRKQVLAYTMNRALLNLPFLRNTSERFRNKLVFRMTEHTYPTGHVIAHGNSRAHDLRLILHGAVEFRDSQDNVLLTLAENTYFGDEHLFVTNSVEPCDIISIAGTRLYSLSRDSFVTLLCSFPEYQSDIMKWGQSRAENMPKNTRLQKYVEHEEDDESEESEDQDDESTNDGDGIHVADKREKSPAGADATAKEESMTNYSQQIEQLSEHLVRFEDILENMTSKVNRLLLYQVNENGKSITGGQKQPSKSTTVRKLIAEGLPSAAGYSINALSQDDMDNDYSISA